MDRSRAHGLGLRAEPPFKPEAVLSTAPASPTDISPPAHPQTDNVTTSSTSNTSTKYPMAPSHSTVAQLSFGPATQQTVTTVTTTTTVSLPPLIMRPPKDLMQRDLKQYPLAFSPTPAYLKRFSSDVNGMPVRFVEEEDAEETVRKHRELHAKIQSHNGSVRSERREKQYHTPSRSSQESFRATQQHNVRASNAIKRTATPPSIAEAAELASLHRRTKKPRSQLHRTYSESLELPSLNQRAASGEIPVTAKVLPVTPDSDALTAAALSKTSTAKHERRRSPTRPSQSRLKELQRDDVGLADADAHLADSELQDDEDSQLEPSFYSSINNGQRTLSGANVESGTSEVQRAISSQTVRGARLEDAVHSDDRARPNLPNLVTSSQQDASLPSPSLSPITAAANLASRQNAFDFSFGQAVLENEGTVPALDLMEDMQAASANASLASYPPSDRPKVPLFPTHEASTRAQHNTPAPTIMDIPTMIDAFDSMPEAMQTYVMYQLLRRCAKPTLQVVANVVNPALKCDPFSVLPVELGLSIIRQLDVQSMCRAAQVSKRWRKHINSDEKAWKDLFDREGFALTEGEIMRAVREGWGWQHSGEMGHEVNLSTPAPDLAVEPDMLNLTTATIISDDEEAASSSSTATATAGNDRKLRIKVANRKQHKRRSVQVSASATKPSTAWSMSRLNRLLAVHKQGPNGLANAATQVVPSPSVGLPSLRSMHLFKSLYQRHHLIRKAWMDEESQPQHLAFRAHNRHVVTCLLFDSDKILTGSDDNKINVYDTSTGALRKRLEGHVGGVWALQYEGDTLVSGSTDRSVRVWDIQSGKCLQIFQGHTSTVRCLVILKPVQVGVAQDGTPIMMPKEPLIITGSRDSTLRVWKLPGPGDRQIFQAPPVEGVPFNDRDNPYFLRTLSGHGNSVRAIAAHGDTLISGSYDATVRVWKISTGDLIHRLQGHTQKVYSVVLDHARNRCISGSMDNLVKVWDLQSGACLFNLEGHTSLVGLLDLSNDRLVSAAADSTLRIWDPESGSCKATLSAHTGAITCFQHDGQKVISGSDRTLKMWNVRNGDCVRDLLTDLSGVWQVRFDERRCVAAVQRSNLTYIEVLDFGASRDGIPANQRGRRIVVDCRGHETEDVDMTPPDPDAAAV